SAWMPAPPLGSEPATVRATGSGGSDPERALRSAAMQLEVYQTDAEAYEAAAALVAERLVAAARGGHAAVALPGGRGGRACMLALAARGEVPWARVAVFCTDECCLPDADRRRTLRVARESLLAPRGVPGDRVHAIALDGRDAASAAASYRDLLALEPALD